GTIRGDFGVTVAKNIIHGSDSLESAEREIGIFFKEEELVDYSPDLTPPSLRGFAYLSA
ncbi:nucleoside-diphosphate kinase, partial [Bacillus cereus]